MAGNPERAQRMADVLRVHQGTAADAEPGEGRFEAAELLADLRLWCDHAGLDWFEIDSVSYQLYLEYQASERDAAGHATGA